MLAPGELVNLRFTSEYPESAKLTFDGRNYTIANGGLDLKRDGGLIAILTMPLTEGAHVYEFRDSSGLLKTGKYRVGGRRRDARPRPRRAPEAPVGYTGPGSRRDARRRRNQQ